jgi:iron complex transport system substrate-binding protein
MMVRAGALAICLAFSLGLLQTRANLTKGCAGAFDPSVDYFPDKATVEDAANFTIEYRRSYKVVRVKEADAADQAETYVLVQCGAPPPSLDGPLTGAQVVTVPIDSLYSSSTTHLPLLVDLKRLDVLTGVSRLKDLLGADLVQRARTGHVREFAPVSVINDELVVVNRPSLFMSGGAGSPSLTVIRNAGVPVVKNIEWRELTALGRAEWIKYMAVFLNEERTAESVYGAMKRRYQSLRARATAQPESTRPLVMAGRSSRGAFVIAGGRSYVAALIADAGGRYVWADNPSTGSASIDLETQVQRAANADIWINGGAWKNLANMLEDEPRNQAFKAQRTGQVWVYERRLTADGSNDYWSRSVSRPDLVLADLIKIFHPSLMTSHAFEWYMQVKSR